MTNLEFNRRHNQQTRRKIGLGVRTFYDRKGRKQEEPQPKLNKKNLALGIAGASLIGGGALLALRNRNTAKLAKSGIVRPKGIKGSVTNPVNAGYVPYKTAPQLPNKVKKTTNQARRSFTDTLGKSYRKGSFLPSGGKGKAVSDVGLVRQGRKPISVAKQTGHSQGAQVSVAVDARNRKFKDRNQSFSFEPYKVIKFKK